MKKSISKLLLIISFLSLTSITAIAGPNVFGGYGTATIHNDTNKTFRIDAFDWHCANYIGSDKLTGRISKNEPYHEKVSDVMIQPNSYYKLPNLLMSQSKGCDGKDPTMHVHISLVRNGEPVIGSIEWYKAVNKEAGKTNNENLHWSRPVIENCGMHHYSVFPKSYKDPQDIYITNTYMPEGATGKLHSSQCDGYRVPV